MAWQYNLTLPDAYWRCKALPTCGRRSHQFADLVYWPLYDNEEVEDNNLYGSRISL